METIAIKTPFIKLDQLLKFSGISQNGVDAKQLILQGLVRYNGEVEVKRGKKVYPGDLVEVHGIQDAPVRIKVLSA